MSARFRMAGVVSDSLIPTPPAGRATIFYNETTRAFKAKYDDGTVVILSVGAEEIQDVVGNFLQDSSTVNFTYNDAGNVMTADVIQSALDISQIPNVPQGNLTSPNVQAALNELQSDIDTRATHIFTTNILYVDSAGNDTTGAGTLEKPYASISKALSTITTNSISNPYKIKVGPGVFNGSITMKSYVWIEGAEQDQTVVVATSGNHAVIGADNSGISKCLITGAGTGFCGVYYKSLVGTTNTSFFVEDVRFGQNDQQAIADGSTAATAIFLENCKLGGQYQFNYGFLGTAGGRIVARNCTTTGLSAPYPNYVFKATGVGSQIVINGAQIRSGVVTGNPCIHLADGAILRALSVNMRMFGKAIWIENTGAGSIVDAVGILCEGNTMDIVVDHPNADGTFNGSADHTKIYVNPASSFSPVFSCNHLPSDGTGFVVVGDILQGDRYDRYANLSLLARKATTLGLIEDTETPFIDFDSGLNVKIIGGTGFVNKPLDLYLKQVSWQDQIISIPANSTKYVYIDHESNLLTSDSPTNPETTITLGRVNSDASAIRFIENSDMPMNHYGNKTEKFLRSVLGPTFEKGCLVTENATPRKLDITPGSYYFGVTQFSASGGTAVSWEQFYRDGVGGWTSVPGIDTVSNTLYDNNSGTPASIPSGKFVRHHLYVVGDGGNEKWFLVLAQQLYNSLAEAADSPLPIVPPFFTDAITRVAVNIIGQGATKIAEIIDLRIRPGQAAPSGTSVTAHGDLTGLLNDDHPQYLLVNGTRPMSGNLNMNGQDITNVGTVNNVVVEAHATRHLPSGADPLATAAPITAVGGNTANQTGTANSLARSDHQHDVATGVVSAQIPDQVNAEGSSNNLARADHVHNIATAAPSAIIGANSTNSQGINASFSRSDHGHQLATGVPSTQTPDQTNAAGSSNNLARADHMHNIPTATAIGLDANSTSTQGAAATFARSNHTHAIASGAPSTQNADQANAAGSSGNFARADHIHNIPTAAPVTIGTANSQGSAGTFAKSDHVHNHGAQTDPTHHAVATQSANGFMSAADKTKLDAITGTGLMKAGNVLGTSFTGNPKKFTVTFSTPFASANYAINISGTVGRTWTYESKTAAGFTISANANTAFTTEVSWTAISNGETVG